ncbi:aminopeptidase [Lutibacter aestuarii]|uniref:Aminopeptidase n=1 Tax=Lutibacter aestuarii TaxID=861111 RepID=A0ABW2Z3J0_9FLAO
MKKQLFLILCLVCLNTLYSQTNTIKINAIFNPYDKELRIQQSITYYNNSGEILNEIYLHNWPNAYKDKNTPLAKRFIENYSKSFHFANEKHRGHTNIKSISVDYELSNWETSENQPDIIKISLKEPLHLNGSVKINATYTVKIPKDKFTNYGVDIYTYNLRYWYLAPAIYNNGWKTYSNLDMDDLYIDYSNYEIDLLTPFDFVVNTDLETTLSVKKNINVYKLTGKHKLDVELNISSQNDFIQFNTSPVSIITNLNSEKLNNTVQTDILNRELAFIESYLGKFPHQKLLVNKIEYDKNPVYGFNQLPSFLAPYADNFEWDIKLFKVISKKYIDQLFLFNMREDAWLADGLQTYLMLKYVEKYYPEIKAIGTVSKIWGIRNFNLAKISFNQKYPFVYQFAARKNLDQALTTQADSLSNFNRKIVNKYKAGLGLQYLENFVGDSIITNAIKNYSKKYTGKMTTSLLFFNEINTEKNIDWFKNDYIKTNKKVDYTIQKVKEKNDSLEITIFNKRNFTTPIQLYGIKDDEIKYKKWLIDIDSIKKITIPKDGFNRISLNYESLLPEYNLRNNWKNIDKKIFNRPLQLKFLKDIENPYYNQFFYTPVARYNYYDGLVLGLAISNKTLLRKSFNYKVTPSYSTKSNSFSGSFAFQYEYLPENKKIEKFSAGITGVSYHYAENLTYNTLTNYALLEFKRKNLRDVESKVLGASYTVIDREKTPTLDQHPETNKYNVFNFGFGYSKPGIINDVRFSTNMQVANKFSKVSLTGQYRVLTDANRQFDFRFFAGAFLTNKTETNFFDFALDRPTDYLFQYDYLGRSETTGILSQQIIINEGGFKSKLPVAYANQWLSTINTSVGLWRWLEVYNDIGFVKNKGKSAYFAYENGIRLNFVPDILEVYFPFYSNLGWEITDPSYSSKIRFVLVIKPKKIYNFIRRGFY